MELINKLREANAMMRLGAKIDLSETINHLEGYIIAQQELINGKRKDLQWRTAIGEYRSFIRYLYYRHGCKRKDFMIMNNLQTWWENPEIESDSVNRLLKGIYLYPVKKRNKQSVTFEQRKNLDII